MKSKKKTLLFVVLSVFSSILIIQQNLIFEHSNKHNHHNYNLKNVKYDINNDEHGRINLTNSEYINEYINNTRDTEDDLLCNEFGTGHGSKENGYNSSIPGFTGCRNWIGNDAEYYGSTNIPFRIDMESINTITNETHRNILINDIREAASIWNQVYMHDDSEYIVNFYEIFENITENDDGNVYEIKKDSLSANGQHLGGQTREIKINYNPSLTTNRPGRKASTVLHEMGHALGLDDLDRFYNPDCHTVLMGYVRDVNTPAVDSIEYQDIQGAAVNFRKHTTHQYLRYYYIDNYYYNVCFYCDRIDKSDSPWSIATALVNADECTHNYQPMVSLGQIIWLKCQTCYKVLKHTEHNYSFSYLNSTEYVHKVYCICGNYITQTHTYENNYCIKCNCHLHTYSALALKADDYSHRIFCSSCSYSKLQPHIFSEENLTKCIICNATATGNPINPQGNIKVTLNGSYELENGIIVLVDEDIDSFFNGILIFYNSNELYALM